MRRFALALLGLLVLVAPSSATWSIVCVNLRTREVGVASATCLANFDLRQAVPVIRVGEGAAAAQSVIDVFGSNKLLIFESFRDTAETPGEILARLAIQDSQHQTRQYGIANFAGEAVTFTGRRDGLAATGRADRVDDYLYAIQGNVLTGDEVVFAAEAAFRSAKGDMGQKMLAAMRAARELGGDGRCSCSENDPTGCGVPPPNFRKSAHIGVMIVARVGDRNGGCNMNRGCATGDYYLNINIRAGVNAPDPVEILGKRYDEWRNRLVGRPDGITSRILGNKPLPADGVTERTLVLELRDLNEERLGHGGARVEVIPLGSAQAPLGPVLDLGDGRYAFTLRAGTRAGVERFTVTVTDTLPGAPDDSVVATLYPELEVETIDRQLYVAADSVSAAQGGRVPFVVNRPDRPGAPYLVVARLPTPALGAAGSSGPVVGLRLLGSPSLFAAPGTLDARGRSAGALRLPPTALDPLVGRRVEFVALFLDRKPIEVTPADGFDVLP